MTEEARANALEQLPEDFNAAEDLLAPNSRVHPDKVAIIDHRGECTYRELHDRVCRMAWVLTKLGVARENRVLLCLTDTRDFPTVFLGAIRAGVLPVPVNTLLTADDYRWMLSNSGARAVFVSSELADKWRSVAESEPDVSFVSSEGGPWTDLEQLLGDAQPAAESAPTHRDDVAFWLYTSGSTGRPKAAMHVHGSVRLAANLYGLEVAGYAEGDVVLSIAKQFFAYGLGNSIIFPYAAGATVVLFNGRATPEAISEQIKRHGVSVLAGVPTFFAGWLAHADCPTAVEVPHLRMATSAGEALPPKIGKAFRKRFGVDVLDGLGSTEMLHVFVSQRPGSVRYGCTGKVVDGYEIRLVDDDGADCAPGVIGGLLVRGPTAAIGYWRNQPKSKNTFRGSWVFTGDKYQADEEGWLIYSGRDDDMLKVGGIYVSPVEVEEVLTDHPDVLEAAVIADKDDDALVKPHGYVVLHQGKTGSSEMEAELKRHVKSKLAPYKYPRWITFVDQLPKTATGKIQRFRLRAGK